jgi:hypothetical protein
VLVSELLGKSIEVLLEEGKRPMPLSTVLALADQMVISLIHLDHSH